MKIIQGTSRHQIQFSSLNDWVAGDNPVRILDSFVDKLELSKLGIVQPITDKSKINAGGANRLVLVLNQ
jgi:hypothetical protein